MRSIECDSSSHNERDVNLQDTRLSRRQLLRVLGAAGVGLRLTGTPAGALAAPSLRMEGSSLHEAAVSFYGHHQSGIATPAQRHLTMAAFDVTAPGRSRVRDLLRAWSQAAARLQGRGSARLSITLGLGPTLFEQNGVDRFGLRAMRPAALVPVPPMPQDQLDPKRSDGDLCLQVCADDPQAVFQAVRTMQKLAHGVARLRWTQNGFGPNGDGNSSHKTPRNLMGFKDGTDNIPTTDSSLIEQEVWVGAAEGPAWMAGGTYLVARRIRMHLDRWEHQSLTQQQQTFGRYKASGAPLGGQSEFEPLNLNAQGADGAPLIPMHAHIRVAREGQRRILRRGYSFSDGHDPHTGELDAGLFFIAFQRDPRRQFIAIQTQLAAHDALNRFITHTNSAVFACPPGARRGGYVGETLLAGA